MGQIHTILVSSLKGGIGKSTIALGVAAALCRRGYRSLLVDCDAGNRCLDLMLGLSDRVLFDLGDVLEGRCAPADALIVHDALPELRFCAAPLSLPEPLRGEEVGRILRELQTAAEADFVICDSAGSGPLMRAVAAHFAGDVLVVSSQQPAAIRAAERTAMLIRELGGPLPRLVISLFEETDAADGCRAGLLDIIDGAHLRCVGVVPRDRSLLLSQERGELPDRRSRAGAAFANIAARLCGEDVRLFSGMKRIRTRRVL